MRLFAPVSQWARTLRGTTIALDLLEGADMRSGRYKQRRRQIAKRYQRITKACRADNERADREADRAVVERLRDVLHPQSLFNVVERAAYEASRP